MSLSRFFFVLLSVSLLFLSACSSSEKVDVASLNQEYEQKQDAQDEQMTPTLYKELKANLKKQNLENRQLLIEMSNLRDKMIELEKMQDQPKPLKVNPVTKTPVYDPKTLYKIGYRAIKQKKFNEARNSFNTFLKEYPRHALADNALYWTGESYYAQKQYKRALHYFTRVQVEYPAGNKVPDSILKKGYAYYSLGRADEAKKELIDMLREYPQSSLRPLAEKMLQRVGSLH